MLRRILIVVLSVLVSVAAVGGSTSMSSIVNAAPTAPSTQPASDLPKECVGSDFATLGKIYDSVFDSVVPYLPANIKKNKDSIKAQTHRDMNKLRISNMLVSNNPKQMGAQRDDPVMKYRDPISLYVISQLLNVRHGKQFQAITVENLTLAQAVETVWMFIHITVIIPLTVVLSTIPNIAVLWGPITVRFLITMPFYIAIYGAGYAYRSISGYLLNSCLVSMTKAEKDQAGKPIKDLRFAGKVPGWIEQIAHDVDLADTTDCKPIGDQSMSRIVDRTTKYLTDTNKDAATKAKVLAVSKDVENRMRNIWVPVNLIPADPADFNQIESLISLLGGYLSPDIPVGDISLGTSGAPLDILIGLIHNFNKGDNMGKTVRLWDLSVTKSMTAAFYTMYFTIYLAQVVWSNGLSMLLPGVGQYIPRPFGFFYAPLNFGFNAYHNVLRSMCFAEDRKVRDAVVG
ncbi:hypothetical protein GOEFS_028_00160 [Gordonia effusa NBRC 100432]|uniref:Uncharacterized protein n=1 Tax=Gordonia effusa NBRC 100432 TaxID=1077974 RepID=H0QX01_9ACTN|nr:hypothetical protein GOEFS_028_00160 [Gordonia effusa NBRC 100432]